MLETPILRRKSNKILLKKPKNPSSSVHDRTPPKTPPTNKSWISSNRSLVTPQSDPALKNIVPRLAAYGSNTSSSPGRSMILAAFSLDPLASEPIKRFTGNVKKQ
jgi:hypothetical protein